MSASGNAVHVEEDQVAENPHDHSAEESLPPIPDGGLSKAMPVWLKQAPGRPTGESGPDVVDMVSLANSLELPPWLAALSQRVEASQQRDESIASAGTVIQPHAEVETQPATEESGHSRALGSNVLAAQQNAAERSTRPAKLQLPPIPAAVPVDAEEFLLGGEVTVTPDSRSRTPFIIVAILIVVLAAAAVWYFGS